MWAENDEFKRSKFHLRVKYCPILAHLSIPTGVLLLHPSLSAFDVSWSLAVVLTERNEGLLSCGDTALQPWVSWTSHFLAVMVFLAIALTSWIKALCYCAGGGTGQQGTVNQRLPAPDQAMGVLEFHLGKAHLRVPSRPVGVHSTGQPLHKSWIPLPCCHANIVRIRHFLALLYALCFMA